MSGRTIGIFVGVGVLGVLSFWAYKQSHKDDKDWQPLSSRVGSSAAVSSGEMPTINAPDDVDKLDITNADKGEIVLEKQGDNWVITSPLKSAMANQQSVKDAINNLKDWKLKEQLVLKLDDDVKKDKQLDEAHAIHIVAFKGGDKKTDVYFGKMGGGGQLVQLAGKPDAVYTATGYSGYLFTREAKDWRDKEIFKFDDANASQITIDNVNGKFSFTKGDKWAGTFKGNPIEKFDDQKVKDFLRDVKALTAEDFGDGKSDSDTGLNAPSSTVTVSLKDGAGTYVMKVGNVAKDTSHYAARMNGGVMDPTVFIVGKTGSDWALAGKDKFQASADAGAPISSNKPAMPPGMPGMPPGMPHH